MGGALQNLLHSSLHFHYWYLFVCMCAELVCVHVHTTVYVWRLEDNLQRASSLLVIRFSSKHLYPLMHLAGSSIPFLSQIYILNHVPGSGQIWWGFSGSALTDTVKPSLDGLLKTWATSDFVGGEKRSSVLSGHNLHIHFHASRRARSLPSPSIRSPGDYSEVRVWNSFINSSCGAHRPESLLTTPRCWNACLSIGKNWSKVEKVLFEA